MQLVNSRVALFLGAGASAPLGLKPTRPYLEQLKSDLGKLIRQREGLSQPFEHVLDTVFNQAGKWYKVALPDSEVVLDYIEFLGRVCHELHRLPQEFRELSKTDGAPQMQERWRDMLYRVRDYIRECVVQHYSRVDGQKALAIYDPLLKALVRGGKVVPIFTTNYDWVFEELAEANTDQVTLEDGFQSAPKGPWWNRQVFEKFQPSAGKMNLVLFKLHGSTSWYRDAVPPHLIRKYPNPRPELAGSTAALIYPTQVKPEAVQEEPFKTAYEYLRETSLRTNLLIVIGFSFRDPAINDILSSSLRSNSNLKLAIVDPAVNEQPGIKLEKLLTGLGMEDKEWHQRICVIKGKFGVDPYVYDALEVVVKKLDQWETLEHWIAGADDVAKMKP